MDFETNYIITTIVNLATNKFQLDASASNILNILCLKIINKLNSFDFKLILKKCNVDISKMQTLLLVLSRNVKYIILVYILNFIYERQDQLENLYNQYFNKDKFNTKQLTITTTDDNGDIVISNRKSFVIDITNIHYLIECVHKYINIHPEFYDSNISYQLINIPDNPESYKVYLDKLIFNDTIHDVDGYIFTQYERIKKTNGEIFHKFTMRLHINKDVNNKECYITNIQKYVEKQVKFGNVINLYYYKILPKNLITNNFYNNDIANWQKDCTYMEETFFSEYKTFLFSIMKSKINYNIETVGSWNNLILHGDPGTGKSTVIYRIATLMKKSIISVDISFYLDKKKELFALFHGQDFQLPESNQTLNIAKNCIIILEEFDNAISKLIDLEKIYKLKQDIIESDFQQKHSMILESNKQHADEEETKDDEEETKENDELKDETMSVADYQRQVMMDEVSHHKKSKNNSKNKEVNKELSISKISFEIDQLLNNNNTSTKSDVLRLGDLLELFQGPVPIKDRIIIATTNHFDKIKTSLPALFRPGRLTPLHFKYLNWDLLNELTMYYFKQEIILDVYPEINLPTSQIVELALKYKSLDNDFESFKNELIMLISLKK